MPSRARTLGSTTSRRGDFEKINVIPSAARFTIVGDDRELREVARRLKRAFATSPHRIRSARFDVDEPRRFEDGYAVPAEEAARLFGRLTGVPNGRLVVRPTFPGWNTSTSLGAVSLRHGNLAMATMLRSYDAEEVARASAGLRAFFEKRLGLASKATSFFPGWTSDRASFVHRAAREADPSWVPSVAPGGLELVPLSRKIDRPSLSVGVNILDLHAVNERLETKSMGLLEDYLESLLGKLSGCEEMLVGI